MNQSSKQLSKEEISAKLIEWLYEICGLSSNEITSGATCAKLGLDSLDQVELLMAIEDGLNIEITDAEAEVWADKTFAECLDLIHNKINAT
jgi:acyl carrier protein